MTKFDKQVNDLLAQAMKQPGVAEIVQAFETQRATLAAYEKLQTALLPRWVVSASSSSAKQQ